MLMLMEHKWPLGSHMSISLTIPYAISRPIMYINHTSPSLHGSTCLPYPDVIVIVIAMPSLRGQGDEYYHVKTNSLNTHIYNVMHEQTPILIFGCFQYTYGIRIQPNICKSTC